VHTTEFKALKLHNQLSALGIKNIGPATSKMIVESDVTLIELFDKETAEYKLVNSGKFQIGSKKLENLFESINDLKEVKLWQVIYAMQYKNCGKTISKQLAKWLSKQDYDFHGLTKNVVESFVQDNSKQNEVKEFVGTLLTNNVNVIKPKSASGLITFEMTKAPTNYSTKGEFKRVVEATGKCIHTSLNKKTDYLVTDTLATSTTKTKKAEKNGTKIITYEEFEKLINSI
jgi:NAD-dependent DNA ligase